MKIKSLLTCMMVSLVTILLLQAQVGKEMKAFRNKDGITVTMLNPSLYSLYKQGDLSLPAEEALKDIKEINVMQVDIKRATPKVVENFSTHHPDRGKRGQIHARAQPPGSLQPRIPLRDTT